MPNLCVPSMHDANDRSPARMVRALGQTASADNPGKHMTQTIARAAAELSAGTTTAQKVAEACLAKAKDPAGEGARAFIALDADKIMAQARVSDALRKRGIIPSPLAGITISGKDLFDVQGEVTKAGSKGLADRPPAAKDAPTIARLRAAGAVLFGRSNMTEFGYSGVGLNPHFGTPACPWHRKTRRIPGGSSSGAAVSVSDGMGRSDILWRHDSGLPITWELDGGSIIGYHVFPVVDPVWQVQ
jgi:Asp-tRNA(Asn)/Glu-tRNA(Gln) amidotransferase A subunit family amidase